MDGHPAGTGLPGPADRTPPIGRLAITTSLTRGFRCRPPRRDTQVTHEDRALRRTRRESGSSLSGQRCEYVSSVSAALAWPSRACTTLADSPWRISSEA